MSVRRLALSVAGMAAIAALLSGLTPALPVMSGALAHAQQTVDTDGADALVLAAAGLLAWAVWLWGAVGLALTALTAAPGFLGVTSSVLVRLVLPTAARRSAAGLLGLSLGVVPLLGTPSVLLPTTASAATTATATASAAVPDWPSAATPPAVPDWPTGTSASDGSPTPPSTHVVVRGDCLWDIAADRLGRGRPSAPTDGEVARAVHAWWSANVAVIGQDPDLLRPGQVLSPPAGP
jgi:nucleoid-associated protein YgaU